MPGPERQLGVPATESPDVFEDTTRLSFNGQQVDILSTAALSDSRIEELSATITDMRVLDANSEGSPANPRVLYVEAEDIDASYDAGNTVLTVKGPRQNFGRGDAIVYIAEYLASCVQSGNAGIFLTHAAATYDEKSDSSFLLIGEKGAGKTTLAIRLCREIGHQLIGNDQVYVGGSSAEELRTYGGNKWFNVRETAIETDAYLGKLLAQKHRDHTRASWNDKVRVDPDSIGVAVRDIPADIQAIFHIRIDPTQETPFVTSWRGVQQNLIVHEKLGRHISAQATPFQDDRGNYLGSLPLVNLEQSIRRRDMLAKYVIQKGVTELFVPDSAAALEYFAS
jgi:hypothetical protein